VQAFKHNEQKESRQRVQAIIYYLSDANNRMQIYEYFREALCLSGNGYRSVVSE
jgi:hypothetical protein